VLVNLLGWIKSGAVGLSPIIRTWLPHLSLKYVAEVLNNCWFRLIEIDELKIVKEVSARVSCIAELQMLWVEHVSLKQG